MDSPRPLRAAAFFDLDKTIIAKSSTLAFSRSFYQGGLINRRAVLRSAYAQFVYLVGGADHEQMERMREYLSAMCAGWDVQQVKDIVAETLHDLIDPLIYDEAATLHRGAPRCRPRRGDREHVGTRGRRADRRRCWAPIGSSRPGWWSRTAATPARSSSTPTRRTRRRRSASWPTTRGTTCRLLRLQRLGDRLPMLEAVGHPYAVNPDRALRREAVTRDWPVLVFTRPVSLRSRITLGVPTKPVLAATAIGAGAAAAGLVWYAARRRERHG